MTVEKVPGLEGTYLVSPPDGADPAAVADNTEADPGVVYAEPDGKASLPEVTADRIYRWSGSDPTDVAGLYAATLLDLGGAHALVDRCGSDRCRDRQRCAAAPESAPGSRGESRARHRLRRRRQRPRRRGQRRGRRRQRAHRRGCGSRHARRGHHPPGRARREDHAHPRARLRRQRQRVERRPGDALGRLARRDRGQPQPRADRLLHDHQGCCRRAAARRRGRGGCSRERRGLSDRVSRHRCDACSVWPVPTGPTPSPASRRSGAG